MSCPTDELRADHAVVTSGLHVLAAIGQHVRRGGSFPAGDTAQTLRFLREFVVATHFRKENEHVWPAIAMRGPDLAATAVGDLMRMQDEAIELITSLVVFWEPTGDLTNAERHGFADAVEALVLRMGRMEEAEEWLLQLCDQCVPADDQMEWTAAFAVLERERTSRSAWLLRLHPLITAWVA